MPPARRHPHALFLLACLSVLALMLLSDFSPPPADDIPALDQGGGELTCLVLSSRTTAKGHVLNLTDAGGNLAKAFCPLDVAGAAPPDGALVRIVAEPSSDDPGFLFVRELEILQGPGGKD